MGILKYRIACTFSGTNPTKDQLYLLKSPTFTLRGWNCYIAVNLQTLPSGKTACNVYLPYPQVPIFHKGNHQCSYYLLSAGNGNHKLVNHSQYTTDWCEIGFNILNGTEFQVVLAIDLDEPTAANSTCWLEGKIEMLPNKIFHNISLSSNYLTLKNGTQYSLQSRSVVSLNDALWTANTSDNYKSLLMTGLRKDEFINALLNITRSNEIRESQVTFRCGKTEYFHKDEAINNVEILSISTEFKKMSYFRIAEIEDVIQTIDSLMSNANVELHELKVLNTVEHCQPPKNSSATLAPSAAATRTALPEQLKLMHKCYTDRKFCDIKILLPDSHEIRAHKNMLFIGSTVWRQLLTEDDQLPVISVTDFDRETIETLVTYIYIDSVPVPPKQTEQLLIAAETYGVDGLKTWCEEQIINTITTDTAITLLLLAHRYKAKTLFDAVLTFIRKHNDELKYRDEWKSVFLSYPELALELFRICL